MAILLSILNPKFKVMVLFMQTLSPNFIACLPMAKSMASTNFLNFSDDTNKSFEGNNNVSHISLNQLSKPCVKGKSSYYHDP